jgi:DNA-binding FadR family transcriptional regulator
MVAMIESPEDHGIASSLDHFTELDKAFHRTLALSTRNAAVIGLIDSLMSIINETMRYSMAIPGLPLQAVYDHRRIFEAVAAHRPKLAARAMFSHIDITQRRIAQASEAYHGSANNPPPATRTTLVFISHDGKEAELAEIGADEKKT